MFARLKHMAQRTRRGTVAIVAVVAMIPVTGMFAASMNTGQMIEDRRVVQDTADALARMHGAWSARSLNVMSMNQVTATQLVTVHLGAGALRGTLIEQNIVAGTVIAYILAHGAYHCTPRGADPVQIAFGAVCATNHLIAQGPADIALIRSALINSRYDPKHGVDVAEKALAAINGMNKAMVDRLPVAVAEIGQAYAKEMGVDDFHFADPCGGSGSGNCSNANTNHGMSLPVMHADAIAQAEFCTLPMLKGTAPLGARYTSFAQRGFGTGKGPLGNGGSSQRPHVRDFIEHKTKVARMLSKFKKFYDKNPLATLLRNPLAGGKLIDKHPKALNLPGSQTENGSNSFNRRFNIRHGIFCFSSGDLPDPFTAIGDQLGNALFPPIERDAPPWVCLTPPTVVGEACASREQAWEDAADEADRVAREGAQDFIDGALSDMGDLLKQIPGIPDYQVWMLDDGAGGSLGKYLPEEMHENFHILAFTEKDKSRRLASQVLNDDVVSHFGYGQVGLYNADSADLYSANWRYRLMPTTRMQNPGTVASNLMSQAHGSFNPLAQSLISASTGTNWDRINAH